VISPLLLVPSDESAYLNGRSVEMQDKITLRVDEAEHRELAGRAERDKVSLSDYIRVRLGLRAEGPLNGDGDAIAAVEDEATRAQLLDHERRLAALEAERAAVTAA
jgi:hypothetical protein